MRSMPGGTSVSYTHLMSALKYWLWLTELPGLTNQTRLALLQHFPTPEDVYYAEAEEVLLTEGITREQAILLENKDCAAADRILADCQRLNVNILTLQDAGMCIRDRLRTGKCRPSGGVPGGYSLTSAPAAATSSYRY